MAHFVLVLLSLVQQAVAHDAACADGEACPTSVSSSSLLQNQAFDPQCSANCGKGLKDWDDKCKWKICKGCDECAASDDMNMFDVVCGGPPPIGPPNGCEKDQPNCRFCKDLLCCQKKEKGLCAGAIGGDNYKKGWPSCVRPSRPASGWADANQGGADANQGRAAANRASSDASDVWDPDRSAKHCRPNNGAGVHKRYRQELLDLDYEDWEKVKEAWRKLQAHGDYDIYPTGHAEHYKEPMKDHGSDGFLPYHRGFIQDLETDLQWAGNDCSIALPYWNWAVVTGNVEGSQFWTERYFGPLGDGCVREGVAAKWRFPFDDPSDKDCVQRYGGSLKQGRMGPTISDLQEAIDSHTTYASFRKFIEATHNEGHCAATNSKDGKSDFCNRVGKKSPTDPTFFMHHGFVDALWFFWMRQNPKAARTCGGCRKALIPWIGDLADDNSCVFLAVNSDHLKLNPSARGAARGTCVRYLMKGEPMGSGDASMLSVDTSEMDSCSRLLFQIQSGQCTKADLAAIPCVSGRNCEVDVESDIRSADEFAALQDDAGSLAEGEQAIRDDDEAANSCQSLVKVPSKMESDMCMGCNYVCKGKTEDEITGDETTGDEITGDENSP